MSALMTLNEPDSDHDLRCGKALVVWMCDYSICWAMSTLTRKTASSCEGGRPWAAK